MAIAYLCIWFINASIHLLPVCQSLLPLTFGLSRPLSTYYLCINHGSSWHLVYRGHLLLVCQSFANLDIWFIPTTIHPLPMYQSWLTLTFGLLQPLSTCYLCINHGSPWHLVYQCHNSPITCVSIIANLNIWFIPATIHRFLLCQWWLTLTSGLSPPIFSHSISYWKPWHVPVRSTLISPSRKNDSSKFLISYPFKLTSISKTIKNN